MCQIAQSFNIFSEKVIDSMNRRICGVFKKIKEVKLDNAHSCSRDYAHSCSRDYAHSCSRVNARSCSRDYMTLDDVVPISI